MTKSANFGNVAALKLSSSVLVNYELLDIGMPGAVLRVCTAGNANRPYTAALLQKTGKKARRLQAGNMSPDLLDNLRNSQRELYAEHVVKGWSGVLEEGGKEVPFSKEDCLGFLRAMPDEYFEQLIAFCSEPSNFREVDAEQVAKN